MRNRSASELITPSFRQILKSCPVLPEDALGHEKELLVLAHFDLRLGVKIDQHQLGAIVLKDHDMAFFLCQLGNFREVLIDFILRNDRLCIHVHMIASIISVFFGQKTNA